MSSINIRAVTPEDISQITSIFARSVLEETASFEIEPPDEAEMLRRLETILEAGYPYLVAEVDNTIAGYAYVSAHRPRPAYRYTVENTVYVAPDYQRRGIARQLLTELINQCRSLGFKQMIGGIGGANHTSSICLHESLGFEKVAQLKNVGFKHDQWLDLILMQRSL